MGVGQFQLGPAAPAGKFHVLFRGFDPLCMLVVMEVGLRQNLEGLSEISFQINCYKAECDCLLKTMRGGKNSYPPTQYNCRQWVAFLGRAASRERFLETAKLR